MRGALRSVLILLFGLLVFAWGLYLRFPYGKLAESLTAEGSRVTVQTGAVKPSPWPIHLSASPVKVFLRVPSEACRLAAFPRVDFQVSPWSLLRFVLNVSFQSGVYDGSIKGSVQVGRERKSGSLFLEMRELDLARWQAGITCGVPKISGRLSGDLSYRWDGPGVEKGRGRLTCTIRRGTLGGLKKFLIPFDPLAFDRVAVNLVYDRGRLGVRSARLQSSSMEVFAKGAVHVTRPLPESRLDLKVRISLSPSARRKSGVPLSRMELRITGTLNRPGVRFIR